MEAEDVESRWASPREAYSVEKRVFAQFSSVNGPLQYLAYWIYVKPYNSIQIPDVLGL